MTAVNGGTAIRVRNREYFADAVGGNTTYTNYSYNINPGLPAMFPWLSGVASNWEKYRFNTLRFFYNTETNSGTSGYVAMGIDMDAADLPASSKQQLLTYKGALSNAPWVNMNISAPLNQSTAEWLYIRSGALVSNLDIKTYDLGTFQIAPKGGKVGESLGEVWVEYDVTLSIPQAQRLTAGAYGAYAISTGDSLPSGSCPVLANGTTVQAPINSFTAVPDTDFPAGVKLLCNVAGDYMVDTTLNYGPAGALSAALQTKAYVNSGTDPLAPLSYLSGWSEGFTNSKHPVTLQPGDFLQLIKTKNSSSTVNLGSAVVRIAPLARALFSTSEGEVDLMRKQELHSTRPREGEETPTTPISPGTPGSTDSGSRYIRNLLQEYHARK